MGRGLVTEGRARRGGAGAEGAGPAPTRASLRGGWAKGACAARAPPPGPEAHPPARPPARAPAGAALESLSRTAKAGGDGDLRRREGALAAGAGGLAGVKRSAPPAARLCEVPLPTPSGPEPWFGVAAHPALPVTRCVTLGRSLALSDLPAAPPCATRRAAGTQRPWSRAPGRREGWAPFHPSTVAAATGPPGDLQELKSRDHWAIPAGVHGLHAAASGQSPAPSPSSGCPGDLQARPRASVRLSFGNVGQPTGGAGQGWGGSRAWLFTWRSERLSGSRG
ncbi:transcription initiation factor TFIID subunit 4-like [Hippopotamus amphibius kiboko]|uniref:transcription initiation factor TFIID subunit 4-like n=1 Tax=Hippopotamus amphibius kiboko TaxID=575201 RepID=UPI002598EA7F|nr:transcription initiation factor TFIID subunit 4-like [Hippopotamus amphibius kiboko]